MKLMEARTFCGIVGPGAAKSKKLGSFGGFEFVSSRRSGSTIYFIPRGVDEGTDELSSTDLTVYTGRPFHDNEPLANTDKIDARWIPEMDGAFGCAVLTGDKVRLHTDLLGTQSIYYCHFGGSLYFASHLGIVLKLLPRPPTLNALGVASQLLSKSQLLDETHFNGILRLSADSELTAEWEKPESKVMSRISHHGGIEKLLDTGCKGITASSLAAHLAFGARRERLSEKSVLMLSGGKDSLAIALTGEAPRNAATYGEKYSRDFLGGWRRGRQLRLNWQAVPYDSWHFGSYKDLIVGLHGGNAGLQVTSSMVAFDWVGLESDRAVVGFLGGELTGTHLNQEDPGLDQVWGRILSQLKDPVVDRYYKAEKEWLKQYIADRFSELSKAYGTLKAQLILDLRYRQSRRVATIFDLCAWFCPLSFPFFQRRLIEECLASSKKSLVRQFVYDQMLATQVSALPLYGRLWNRFPKTLVSKLIARKYHRQRPVAKVHWKKIYERTPASLAKCDCGDSALDAVSRESWENGLQNGEKIFTLSIPIAIAARGGP